MARKRLTELAVKKLKPPASGRVEIWDATLPGFGLRVTSRGVKTFFVGYRVDGLRVRHTIGQHPRYSLAEARKEASQILQAADKGDDPRKTRQKSQTFRQLANRYLELHAEPNLKPSSYAGLKRYIDVEILPILGNRPPAEIHRREIVRLLDAIAERAPYTANRVRSALSSIFNWAIKRGEMQISPVANVGKPTREKRRDRTLADEEIAAIWNSTAALSPAYRDLYRLLILLGQRRGQTARISRNDVDFRKRIWRVPAEEMKSGRYHEIPLPSRAAAILRRIPKIGNCPYFLTTNGKTPINGFSKIKSQLDKECGISNWRAHDIRRSVATGLSRLGANRIVIEKILDHADHSVTAIYDRHSYEPEKREALENWAHYIRKLTSPKAKAARQLERV